MSGYFRLVLLSVEPDMSLKENKPIPEGDVEPASGEVNVDRIRDILFGGKMQDYERRFDTVEKSLAEETERVRQGLSSRLNDLEGFFKREFERLAEQQMAERKERMTAMEAFSEAVTRLDAGLREVLDSLEAQGDQERMAIRNELLERTHELNESIRHGAEELRTLINEETRRLQQDKPGREELSRLMSEIAMRLSGNFQLPEA